MLLNFLERYRHRKSSSLHVPRHVLDDVLAGDGTDDDLRELKEATLEYVLVAVRGETSEMISERMGAVAELASQHNGMIDSLVSSLVIITYGIFNFDTETRGDRFTLIEALSQNFGDSIKIVHGVERGYFGLLGSDARADFSFIIPGFLEALGTLANLNFGEIKET